MTNVRRFVIAATATMLCAGVTAAFAAGEKGEGGEKKLARASVPKAVIGAFTAAYPNATLRGFSSETEDGVLCYEIESLEGAKHRDILYHADGTVVVVEEGIAAKDLPGPVSAAFAKLKPAAKLVGAEKITKGGVTAYELHLKQGGKASELVLNASGEKVKL